MGRLNAEYGSELHLLRYLGRHRHLLHQHIEKTIPGRMIDWVDFNFDAMRFDAEWLGVDFLPNYLPAKNRWKEFWPQTGTVQNWDAIGWIEVDSHPELLLVEAKAHAKELFSQTGAKPEGGLGKIQAAFVETKKAMGVADDADWTQPYYQYCNRLATLHFLTQNGIGARMLFIYFCGDRNPNESCPTNEDQWKPELSKMYTHTKVTGGSELEKRVHSIFLPVFEPATD